MVTICEYVGKMIKLLSYLIKEGTVTERVIPEKLSEDSRGMPALTAAKCVSDECQVCTDLCPTEAIVRIGENQSIQLDLGACIGCGLCVDNCPTGTISSDLSSKVARSSREDLILSTEASASESPAKASSPASSIFSKAIACRVVSTGCSACDLEVAACTNSIFDMDRFGISIVASPRFADVLLVTGPVPKSMHSAIESCYQAMPDPKKVIAVGTCACSGGVHKGGYASANGLAGILPVDLYIPGCPPHPWSIIQGIQSVMSGRS